MSDHLVESPAPAMSESAFQRRREHLLAELESVRRRTGDTSWRRLLLPSCSRCWRSLRSVARALPSASLPASEACGLRLRRRPKSIW